MIDMTIGVCLSHAICLAPNAERSARGQGGEGRQKE